MWRAGAEPDPIDDTFETLTETLPKINSLVMLRELAEERRNEILILQRRRGIV